MQEDANSRLQGSKYDKILRENMRFIMPGIIEKVFKLNVVNSQELKDKIQITRQKEVDVLRVVTDADGHTYILHVEIESRNKLKMHFRMGEYRCMLHQVYNHPVRQHVLYMGKAPLSMPNRIDLPGLQFEYTLISFAELSYKTFLSSKEPEEQILAVLGNFGTDDPTAVVQAVLEKIGKNNPGPITENKYYQQLRIIIQLRNLDEKIDKAMLEIKTFWKKERDTLYKWGKEDGIQKGIEQGEAKGRHEEALEIARELKKEGLTAEFIAKTTKLSVSEIKAL